MEKFGKSNKEMLSLKTNFFSDDKILLENQLKIGDVYLKQPLRKKCKNCNSNLEGEHFDKQNISYVFCKICYHLNGIYQDTSDFCQFMYTDNDGESYSKNYTPEDYSKFIERVNQVYNPKVEFLINSLKEQNEIFTNMSYLDFGCGMGYFLKSLKNYNIKNILGFEVSKTFVDKGNILLNEKIIKEIDINDFVHEVKNIDVMSMIGVLEHLEEPYKFLSNIQKIKGLKYLYISVPTFSFSSFLEVTSQDHFSRQLGSGHTHLYTDKSLRHLEKIFSLERVSEWWFGTDMLDLFRHFSLNFNGSKSLKNEFKNYFVDLIDNLQLEIDKQKKSSEVHILYKLN
tara:strand:+ start:1073 stop:2095 length:1023 start_codon:yes stop_codon:yes gene_type:complete